MQQEDFKKPTFLLLVLVVILLVYTLFSTNNNLRQAVQSIEVAKDSIRASQALLERSRMDINESIELIKQAQKKAIINEVIRDSLQQKQIERFNIAFQNLSTWKKKLEQYQNLQNQARTFKP